MESTRPYEGSCAELSIEPASAWDILFLLSEVYAGSAAGHFSQASRTGREQLSLAVRCCRAILSHKRSSPDRPGLQFFVARHAGVTVGAAFASTAVDDEGRPTVTLEHVVVDSRCRRAGVGEALLNHVVGFGPAVECWCTPNSVQMEGLLRKRRFRCIKKAAMHTVHGLYVVSPALWRWDARAIGGERVRRLTAAVSRGREEARRAVV